MGCLQALEVVKIASGQGCILCFAITNSHVACRTNPRPFCSVIALNQHSSAARRDFIVSKSVMRSADLCRSDETKQKQEYFRLPPVESAHYSRAIVSRSFCGFSAHMLTWRLTSENSFTLSGLLICIVILRPTPGSDASARGTVQCCFHTTCCYGVHTQMGHMPADSLSQAARGHSKTKWRYLWLGVPASCGQKLVMFDAQDARFRSIKLRPKQAGCAVCGDKPSVTKLVDYESFCGSAATDKVGHESDWIWHSTFSLNHQKIHLLSHFPCFSAANSTSSPGVRGSLYR